MYTYDCELPTNHYFLFCHLQIRLKAKMLVEAVTGDSNALAHREGCQHCTDAEAVNITQKQKSQGRSQRQTGNIEGNLNLRISNLDNAAELTRE